MFFIEIGLMIGIIILASSLARYFFGSPGRRHGHWRQAQSQNYNPEATRMRYQERAAARELYERLVREKLTVIRDAIAMGYSETDLDNLDKRLAALIGEEELKKLISEAPDTPVPNADLLDTDLMSEVEKLRKGKEKN